MPKTTRRKRFKLKRNRIKQLEDHDRMVANTTTQYLSYMRYLMKNPKDLVRSICPALFKHHSTGKSISDETLCWYGRKKTWTTVYRDGFPKSQLCSGVVINAKFEGGSPRMSNEGYIGSCGSIRGKIRKGAFKPDHYPTAIEVCSEAYTVAYDPNLCCFMTVSNRERVVSCDLLMFRHDGSMIACWI